MCENNSQSLERLKRTVRIYKNYIYAKTEYIQGCEYAFYLEHLGMIEKVFYSKSPEGMFTSEVKEGEYTITYFYQFGKNRVSFKEVFFINSSNEVIKVKSIQNEVFEKNIDKKINKLMKATQDLYIQLESFSWLQRCLNSTTQLPHLRSWASSPDVLLRLHNHIVKHKPDVIVEFGSGASTLVIADALSQNGIGKLFSIDHSEHYGAQTISELNRNGLQTWVDLRVGALEPWNEAHLNPKESSNLSLWYPKSILQDIENVDLIWVDGPPGNICPYSRYPALPSLSTQLSENIEVWMDDTIRQVEKDICEDWSKKYGFDIEYYDLEKGLGVLTSLI